MKRSEEAERKVPLPSCFNIKDKSHGLDIIGNGLRLVYKGKSDIDAATAKANNPISSSVGCFYFEVKIINKGRDGYIAIGVCSATMNLGKLPGWEKNTYGYHGGDGNLLKGSVTGHAYGPAYTTNDVVGCCVNFITNTIFFTKNGIPLGEATNDIKGVYYPCVGLRTLGEVVEANFGAKPFMFDFNQYLSEEKKKVFDKISAISYPEGDSASNSLILSFLVHHGYKQTVEAFARESGIETNKTSEQLTDIENRQSITELVRSGQIDKAISTLNIKYPDFLQSRRDILFQLLAQKFIEMIKSAPIEQTMVFAQKELYKFEKEGPQFKKDLEEVFSLISYVEPQNSPMSYLLDHSRREPITTSLNCALLVHTGRPAVPPLEKLVRQTSVVVDEVLQHGLGAAAVFMNVPDFIKQEASNK
eukprot:TRINITY_DN6965_c0_g1_i1.p1 TRINITY_DN6965_c0_g1~~TRINITY_DN6965_c0_g1_i1.p1  ORF type:complete len:417 (+),score=100.70 TRINITY_DN6965_c0_g1_i1:159-1409(+)